MFKIRVMILLAVVACWPTLSTAETSHTCAGYIDSLPATITTQGVWCLRKDLSTAIAWGNAVTVNNHNVVVDCNGYKIGGAAAGVDTYAGGVYSDRNNVTVRNCNVRGFSIGIHLADTWDGRTIPATGGSVVDNRVEANSRFGIMVESEGATVRGNSVVNTGRNPHDKNAVAIWTYYGADIIDNLIDGVYPSTLGDADLASYGIIASESHGGVIAGNRIRNVTAKSFSQGILLWPGSLGVTVKGNVIHMPGEYGAAIECDGGGHVVTMNMLTGPYAGLSDGCVDGGGNVVPIPQ